jgi:hypothetical protein
LNVVGRGHTPPSPADPELLPDAELPPEPELPLEPEPLELALPSELDGPLELPELPLDPALLLEPDAEPLLEPEPAAPDEVPAAASSVEVEKPPPGGDPHAAKVATRAERAKLDRVGIATSLTGPRRADRVHQEQWSQCMNPSKKETR